MKLLLTLCILLSQVSSNLGNLLLLGSLLRIRLTNLSDPLRSLLLSFCFFLACLSNLLRVLFQNFVSDSLTLLLLNRVPKVTVEWNGSSLSQRLSSSGNSRTFVQHTLSKSLTDRTTGIENPTLTGEWAFLSRGEREESTSLIHHSLSRVTYSANHGLNTVDKPSDKSLTGLYKVNACNSILDSLKTVIPSFFNVINLATDSFLNDCEKLLDPISGLLPLSLNILYSFIPPVFNSLDTVCNGFTGGLPSRRQEACELSPNLSALLSVSEEVNQSTNDQHDNCYKSHHRVCHHNNL